MNAERLLDEAALPATKPYAHEVENGYWDLPPNLQRGGTCKATNRRLFQEVPYWVVFTAFNPLHFHIVDEKKTKGVWWVWEANPILVPRVHRPCFPLLLRRHDDGNLWVDRDRGVPTLPSECFDVILGTLRHKDIFNTQLYKRMGDSVRLSDKALRERDARVDEGIAKLKESVVDEIVHDMFSEKIAVPSNYKQSGSLLVPND